MSARLSLSIDDLHEERKKKPADRVKINPYHKSDLRLPFQGEIKTHGTKTAHIDIFNQFVSEHVLIINTPIFNPNCFTQEDCSFLRRSQDRGDTNRNVKLNATYSLGFFTNRRTYSRMATVLYGKRGKCNVSFYDT